MTKAVADKLGAALQNHQDLLEIICNDCLARFKAIKQEGHGPHHSPQAKTRQADTRTSDIYYGEYREPQ